MVINNFGHTFTEKVTIRVPEKVKQALKEQSEAQATSISSLLRQQLHKLAEELKK